MNSLLVAPPSKINLDSFVAEPAKLVHKSPTNLVPDFKHLVIVEVPEEEKNSNFGDYGTESESEESDATSQASNREEAMGGGATVTSEP